MTDADLITRAGAAIREAARELGRMTYECDKWRMRYDRLRQRAALGIMAFDTGNSDASEVIELLRATLKEDDDANR